MPSQNSKDEYARTVALFLAELLRTRQVNLVRATEIAQKVVQNINLLDTEQHFLELIVELHKDFDELHPLLGRMNLKVQISEKEKFEQRVKEFAIYIMATDLTTAHAIMHEALSENHTIDSLSAKYPLFKEFIQKS